MDSKNMEFDKLTPSAKNALKDISNEISSKIFSRAMEIAQSKDTFEMEISLRDIIEAKEQILNSTLRVEKSSYAKNRFSLIIALSGAIYAFAGLFLYIYQNRKIDLESNLGLIVAGIGALTMLTSFIYSQLNRKKDSIQRPALGQDYGLDSKFDYDVVQRWQVIERLASDIMRENGFTENKAKSVNSIIEFLSTHLADDESVNKLRQLLTTRNRILHESYQPTRNEKSELISFSNLVIQTLESMLK